MRRSDGTRSGAGEARDGSGLHLVQTRRRRLCADPQGSHRASGVRRVDRRQRAGGRGMARDDRPRDPRVDGADRHPLAGVGRVGVRDV